MPPVLCGICGNKLKSTAIYQEHDVDIPFTVKKIIYATFVHFLVVIEAD